jgi:prepilin-type processing-associated H-X9-DG protein
MAPKDQLRGLFFRMAPVELSFADVKDGTTNTILVGECTPAENAYLRRSGDYWYKYPHGNWACFNGGNAHSSTVIPMNYHTNENMNCDYDDQGQGDNSGDPARSSDNWGVVFGFKSRHPGGCNFLFCDGSVHFLSEDISAMTYNLLGCRNDGRSIEDF